MFWLMSSMEVTSQVTSQVTKLESCLNCWQCACVYTWFRCTDQLHLQKFPTNCFVKWKSAYCTQCFPLLSAVNIGMHRDADNKWVTLRCAFFCVLNSVGQVLTWKLTNSVKFTQCSDVLANLHGRLQRHQKPVREFVIDNCCS